VDSAATARGEVRRRVPHGREERDVNDDQLLRYSRQILLGQVDVEGQERLMGARVLVVGLGGLGSPVAMYLAAAGVGHLVLVDFDEVDLTNLQRQILHTTDRVGLPKTASAQSTLGALNPEVRLSALPRRLDDDELAEQARLADVVVDGTDTFASRNAINAACVATRTPLVSGAAIGMGGQVTVYRLDREREPCYRCLYSGDDYPEEPCSQFGVFTPLVGIVGSIQAAEAMKVILDLGDTLTGRMLMIDCETMDFQEMSFGRNPACPECGTGSAGTHGDTGTVYE
jgi:adenylyltransferase/sulfurtransferase